MLAQAGYPHGFTTFLITVSGDVAGQAEAVVIKSELAAVGITVNIQSYELTTAYSKEDGGHSQMGERYWTNDIIDPDEVATFGADCQGGANAFSSYWCDSPIINAVNQARSELNSTVRQQLYNQVQQAVYRSRRSWWWTTARTATGWATGCTGSTRPRSATTTCPWRRSP